MTNGEKAKELVKKLFDSKDMTTFQILVEMAEWKDAQYANKPRSTDNYNFN